MWVIHANDIGGERGQSFSESLNGHKINPKKDKLIRDGIRIAVRFPFLAKMFIANIDRLIPIIEKFRNSFS